MNALYALPAAFFHDISGFGNPSALQATLASEPWANCLSVGSTVHRGGTENRRKVRALVGSLYISRTTETSEEDGWMNP